MDQVVHINFRFFLSITCSWIKKSLSNKSFFVIHSNLFSECTLNYVVFTPKGKNDSPEFEFCKNPSRLVYEFLTVNEFERF